MQDFESNLYHRMALDSRVCAMQLRVHVVGRPDEIIKDHIIIEIKMSAGITMAYR